jgi:hypothetical protein
MGTDACIVTETRKKKRGAEKRGGEKRRGAEKILYQQRVEDTRRRSEARSR